MLKIFGTEVSTRSILEAQVHTIVEVATLVGWLALAQGGETIWSVVVLIVGLDVEHILALAAGKDA